MVKSEYIVVHVVCNSCDISQAVCGFMLTVARRWITSIISVNFSASAKNNVVPLKALFFTSSETVSLLNYS